MKNNLFKKLLPAFFIALILANALFFVQPKKAVAQAAATFDFANFIQSIWQGVTAVGTNLIEYSNQYKEYVLDPLVSGAAKFLIKKITASVVNWINSGFQGSPAFIQDPGAFFLDVADQSTAQFIAKSGPLTALCSNFNLDLRLALAFKYHPSIEQRYTCTLGTIIRNGRNAVENNSINGFLSGDFQQGGWPAFVSLTTQPQNNVYGSYIQADTELSLKVLSAQTRLNKELDQGKGFLSWKSCKQVPIDTNVANNAEVLASENPLDPRLGDYYDSTTGGTVEKCTTETPGSVIAGSLETQLGSGIRKLELADEIGEIVDALFAQVATQILQGGLASASRKDSSGSSPIARATADLRGDDSAMKAAKREILTGIKIYIKDTTSLKKWKDQSGAIVVGVKNTYDAAKACYAGKIASSTPPLDASQIAFGQAKIQEIDTKITVDFAPFATPIITSANEASSTLQNLLDIEREAAAAQTLDEIDGPSTQYGYLIQSRTLVSAKDISDAREEVKDVRRDAAPFQTDANRRVAECNAFTSVTTTP